MVQEEVRKSQDQLNETKTVELGHQWVDEMECSWKRVTWSELAMKNGALTEFLPDEIRIRYPAIFFEFAEMGPSWNTRLLINYVCKGNTCTHSVRLKLGTVARKIQKEARPGAPYSRGRTKEGETENNPYLFEQNQRYTVRKSWRHSTHVPRKQQLVRWLEMTDEGGPKTQISIPWCDPNTHRPYIVVCSAEDEKIIIIELTVSWKEGWDEAHERKNSKYRELKEACHVHCWKT